MIIVERLIYEYPGKRALDDVSFTIQKGTITALVGPNGSGKTTLLRCMAALDEPFSGRILLDGIDVANEPRRVHQYLGYLSDFFGVYGELTVRQSLLFAARLHRYSESEAARRVEWVVELMELGDYLHRASGSLSRGWKQRLGIAQSIIHHPSLLLLDEPASGLDPEARVALSGVFKQLQNEGMTLVVSSHILAELEDYCTDMLVIREGKLVHHRTSIHVSQQPRQRVSILFVSGQEVALTLLAAQGSVSDLQTEGSKVSFMFGGNETEQAELLADLIKGGARIQRFAADPVRLQDVYMALGAQPKEERGS